MRICILILLLPLLLSCKKENETVPADKLLHAVRGADPGIYDADGRYVLLRGVNYNVLGDYWQANPAIPATAAYDPDHFRQMASYGFNCVRLIFNWSKLEPQRGVYNEAYVLEIRKAIEDAAKHGIYIILDMHQDAWGKYIATPQDVVCQFPAKGWDGAPDWATFTDGQSTCTVDGSRESSPAVYRAFFNFWKNREGIQDACIAAWQHLVKATCHYPTVAGYDLLNEPSLGDGDLANQNRLMKNYYSRLTHAIRQAEREVNGPEHIIFFEMSVTWAGNPLPTVPGADLTQDDNIVFAPHNYFEVIGPAVLTIEQGYALYNELANSYRTHCFIGEWGVFGDPATDLPKLKRFAQQEDQYLMGSTWWQWCQAPGDPHGISWDGTQYGATAMHLLEVAADGSFTGNKNDLYLKVLSRARPVAIAGKPLSFSSDPDSGVMELRARVSNPGVTELWIPGHFGEPVISGDNIRSVQKEHVEGGFIVRVSVENEYVIRTGQ